MRQRTVADTVLSFTAAAAAAADSGVLAALEEGKSEEEAFRVADSGAVASVIERTPGEMLQCFIL
jgi:hypothetical protein